MRQRHRLPFGVDLIGLHIEVCEVAAAEAGRDGHVSGVAAGRHQDAAIARIVVACVHVPPAAIQPDLVPGAEVAGAGIRHADVADVAGDVARGDVHAARERDGKVLIIAADADALGEDVHGGLGGARGFVVEGDVRIHPIADGRGQRPTGSHVPKEIVCDAAKAVDLAVAAGQQKLERLGGQLVRSGKLGAEALQLGLVRRDDGVAAAQANRASGSQKARAAVAEAVEILFDGKLDGALAFFNGTNVLDLQAVGSGEHGLDRGMHMEHRHHGCWLQQVKLDVVFRLNQHKNSPARENAPGS